MGLKSIFSQWKCHFLKLVLNIEYFYKINNQVMYNSVKIKSI